MSISPASDLILDVARAADPQAASATTRALAAAGAGGGAEQGGGFAMALARTPGLAQSLPDLGYKAPSVAMNDGLSPARRAKIGLESLLLKEMVEHMLPKDAEAVFGGGMAGEMWRSMMAEKVADSVARSGALKIGDRLFATHGALLRSSNSRHGGGAS